MKKSKKDISIELLRILGCIIVIGVHVFVGAISNNEFVFARTYIQCLVADGVAMFFMITGAFLFRSSYGKVMRRTLFSVAIPLLVVNFFSFYFYDFLYSNVTLIESLHHTKEEYISFLKQIVVWRNASGFGHLWYLYAYLLLMVMYPIIKAFVDYLNTDNKLVLWYMGISFTMLLVNDISHNKLMSYSHTPSGAVLPAINLLIWGHIVYKNKSKFSNPLWTLLGIAVFFGFNFARAKIQYNNYVTGIGYTHILYWYTSAGLIGAVSLMIACISLFSNANAAHRSYRVINSIIQFCGNQTFLIYIIHYFVLKFLKVKGVTAYLSTTFRGTTPTVANDMLYMAVYGGIILAISFVLSVIINTVTSCFIKLFKKQHSNRAVNH